MADLQFKVKAIPNKGRMVYEYNPFFNFRYSTTPKDSSGNTLKDHDGVDIEAYVPTDFDTTNSYLNFDLNHPVDITCQDSYDGSVNLILNDNKNIPRMINSRFTVRENNTYEVVDREGNNDTNLYDDDLFDNDTSLYKRIVKSPIISLYEVSNAGGLQVGNYVFYIAYVDADENETDIAAESGLVSCFIGANATPSQINGGYKDLNSYKAITLKIDNLDRQYDYIRVYYSRASSDADENVYTSAKKIVLKYPITTSVSYITITGLEDSDNIPLSDLNLQYLIATKVKTLAQCLNRLYFGNIAESVPEHKVLKDLSLRIFPTYSVTKDSNLIGKLNGTYKDYTTTAKYKYLYYNVFNIYNYVGYWPEEFYRFGIVYIMKDGTLSPVYNTLGVNELCLSASDDSDYKVSTNSKIFSNLDASITVDEATYKVNGTSWNGKGVVKFPAFDESNITNNTILSINFKIEEAVFSQMKKYAQGFFFVRLKRIPTILCLGMTLDMDLEANIPLLKGDLAESFINPNTRKLTNEYKARLITTDLVDPNTCACICPDYDLNPAFYNLIFTGGKFTIKVLGDVIETSTNNARHRDDTEVEVKEKPYLISDIGIAAVPDSAPSIIVDDCKFRARAGEELDAGKLRYLGHEDKTDEATNLIRGLFGPYLGFTKKVEAFKLLNIYIPDYSTALFDLYRKQRYDDNSEYLAISNRYDFEGRTYFEEEFFRGDCFLCTSTHRLNRNFLDSTAPMNDIIIDPSTWKNSYKYGKAEKIAKIDRGDVNAVKMGTWLTMYVRSTRNLGLRALDLSYPSEQGMFGHPRGFYPLQGISADGDSKIAESYIINGGYETSLGNRWNFTLPYMPAIKNKFLTRIAYSDIAINDAFKNGYRVFKSGSYRDYTMNYGSIVKLIEFSGNLLCVFEHGVALIPVNERVASGSGAGGDVFINTSNVLPENPKMLSDTFGTLWPESVIKTLVYVYGVDTVGKKIWRTNGANFELISDFKMLRFLNENISLGEFEMTPVIGIRNVKSHYNAFKHDVMFTFYDYTKGINEVSWNLCYNEYNEAFVTFYSWIPSYSDNIHNIYFSFDRDTSKLYTKLAASLTGNPEATGITVEACDISTWTNNTTKLSLSNVDLPDYGSVTAGEVSLTYTYSIIPDNLGYYKAFSISGNSLTVNSSILNNSEITRYDKEFYLQLQCVVEVKHSSDNSKSYTYGTYQSTTYLIKSQNSISGYSTYFWKHGLAGIFDCAEKIKPTFWYGKQHPFEFEVTVADKPTMHKIFNALRIMSNKTAPESFHYEVVGETYDWAWDKKNMYFRLEATKCLYLNLGSDITYDYTYLEEALPNYLNYLKDDTVKADISEIASNITSLASATTVMAKKALYDNIFNKRKELLAKQEEYGLTSYTEQQVSQIAKIDWGKDANENDIEDSSNYVFKKSTIFPATYLRLDKLEEIADTYIFAKDVFNSWYSNTISAGTNLYYNRSYDYEYLSGSELKYDKLLNEFRVCTHAKALDLKNPTYGRLRGNMQYKEDMWYILINSIIFALKNEQLWNNAVPPIAIVGLIPLDLTALTVVDEVKNNAGDTITDGTLTNTDIALYTTNCIDSNGWSSRLETKPRDKYIKIRVRYDGKNLALINSLTTLYTISYA